MAQRAVAVSTDGRALVYAATERGVSRLYWRPLDANEDTAIAGTEGGFGPFFHPDGSALGFFKDGKLFRVELRNGGPDLPTEIGNVGNWPAGAAWLADGRIYLHHWNPDPKLELLADPSTAVDADLGTGSWPTPIAGSNRLLTNQTGFIVDVDLDSGASTRLFEGAGARYVSSRHLVYELESRLHAGAFDPDRRELVGNPETIEQYVRVDRGVPQFDVSTRTLAYVPGPSTEVGAPVWVDADGQTTRLPIAPDEYTSLDLSNDGRRLAVAVERQLGVFDVETGVGAMVTGGQFPKWSPDDQWIAFSRYGENNQSIVFRARADGSAPEELASGRQANPHTWSPDGNLLIYGAIDPDTGTNDLWVVDVEAKGAPEPFAQTSANETQASFSPGGDFVAYVSSEGGRDQVYVQPYPVGEKKAVSIDGGFEPLWCGNDIVYRESAGRLMIVNGLGNGAFSAPEQLVDGDFRNSAEYNYDVAPTCDRVLALAFGPATEIDVVLHWADDLAQPARGKSLALPPDATGFDRQLNERRARGRAVYGNRRNTLSG